MEVNYLTHLLTLLCYEIGEISISWDYAKISLGKIPGNSFIGVAPNV